MSIKIKAGTRFKLPVTFEDVNFAYIRAIEFMFKQNETGDPVKTAYWSRDGESRDAEAVAGEDNMILVSFSREDSYLFTQNEMFFIDTRIYYDGTDENPYTPIVRVRMNNTLFQSGEEATP